MRFIYFTFVFQMDEVMTRKDFEVMAPVGSYESLYAALQGGADSVYFGVEGLNMRARSSANFTLEDLKNIVSVCSEKGVKTYLTVNTVIYNQELEKMRQVIDCAGEAGVTAIIASDLAAILYARSVGVEVHISTQCNVTNFEVVRFFAQYADVIVLAREVVLEQVMEIHRRIVGEDLRGPNGGLIKIEMFAHGALCMAVSGKCYLSLHEKNASANRGACNQICRRAYTVKDRENEVELDIENEYIMSPKDLCTVDFLDKFLGAGVRVLKIEGRAKTFYYVASVTAAYRRALDAYLADPLNDNFELPAEVYEELTRTSHRHYSPGFYFGREQAKQATDSATYIREWEFVGTVDRWENGVAHCQQRGKWSLGDTLEALCPDGRSIPLNPEWIENEAGERVESTPHAMEKYTIPTPELPPMSLLRRKTV